MASEQALKLTNIAHINIQRQCVQDVNHVEKDIEPTFSILEICCCKLCPYTVQ